MDTGTGDTASVEMPFQELLAQNVSRHKTMDELSSFLTWRIHALLRRLFRRTPYAWSTPDVLVEPSFDRARSQLSSLMTATKENLIATITKNDKVDNAVALVDWRALEVLCSLAERGLEATQKFGEFAAYDKFSSEEALQLSQVDVHRPLAVRQTVAERREALRKFSMERPVSDDKSTFPEPESLNGELTKWRTEFLASLSELESAAKKEGSEGVTKQIHEVLEAAEKAATDAKAAAVKAAGDARAAAKAAEEAAKPGALNLTLSGDFDDQVLVSVDGIEVARSRGKTIALERVVPGLRKISAHAKKGTKDVETAVMVDVKPGLQELELLLHDAPPRREAPRKGARLERDAIVSLDQLAVDIARIIDHDAAAELWDRYERGERNVFTRKLYTMEGLREFEEIRTRYRSDRDFMRTVDRYIGEFERLLKEVSRDDRGEVLARTYLTSETGKVYTVLAHAAGRFD
jgi:hypothetical protein